MVMKFTVTGGPCGGKTTVMEAIEETFGPKVVILNEVASAVLGVLFPIPGRQLDYGPKEIECLQNTIFHAQKDAEKVMERMAQVKGAKALILDRGLLEGAAYVEGGIPWFEKQFKVTAAEVYARYTGVIHLESLAKVSSDLYNAHKGSNDARYEDVAQACQRDDALQAVWREHPNWHFVPGRSGIAAVTHDVLMFLSGYLDTEIEKKYYLPHLPNISLGNGVRILQGYLIADDCELRVRRYGDETLITSKGKGLRQRSEWERSFPEPHFEMWWRRTEGRRIEKTRYIVPHGSYRLEVDVYEGNLRGLVTLEVEVPTEDDLRDFVLPDWAREAVDVTEDPRYKNRNLATHGLPK